MKVSAPQYIGWRRTLPGSVCLSAATLSLCIAAPALAQPGSGAVLEEVIVSARRQQENIQDIPLSVTVLSQESLNENNIVSSADLRQIAPSLSVNTRFGADQASFAIRGFTQELRTTASVGFYFADVVAPRGNGSMTAGDGAGPGAFFDLQNVLILKGPQGTLFGRNTTGGAVLITPQEPTHELEGYIEGSAGNFDMKRLQGVLNIPVSDSVRARFGVDTMQRDGYLKNRSGVGPSRYADTDYLAARASVVVDVTDSLQNYTILSYTDSENNGTISGLYACRPGLAQFNMGCTQQLAHQGDDFYAIESITRDPESTIEQWQVINTTTWEVSDSLTVKNILSYAELEQNSISQIFGINYDYYGLGTFSYSGPGDKGIPTNAQTSFVEELQFQGYAFDDRLTWQAGLYYENSKPDGVSGPTGVNRLFCTEVDVNNPLNSRCVDVVRNHFLNATGRDAIGAGYGPGGFGTIIDTLGEIEYTTKAVYAEGTYDLTDNWRVTAGLRYTDDETNGTSRYKVWNGFPYIGGPATPGAPTLVRCQFSDAAINNDCKSSVDQNSDAVTGLLSFDYFLTQDVMLYAKYSRGYRMGSVSNFAPETLRTFEPEEVDAYEIGAKTKFGGIVPGTFNLAVFYNDLTDQQLQYGFIAPGIPATTAIVNAGSSVIQGAEVEAALMFTRDLQFKLSYSYLDTELKEIVSPTVDLPPGSTFVASAVAGEDLPYSPQHSLVANLNYRLPLPVELGDVTVGVTYNYTDQQNSSSGTSSPYARMDSYEVFNANLNWMSIMGSNFDASLFVTNALDDEYTVYVSGNYNSLGYETRQVGPPRMWGARLRYTFGAQ